MPEEAVEKAINNGQNVRAKPDKQNRLSSGMSAWVM
jgi:hypothetical protein